MSDDFDFAIACPHCGAATKDPFEVFTRGAIARQHCMTCGKDFHFLIADCEVCEEESVFTWPEEPIGLTKSDLKCLSCGAQYGHDREAQDGEAIW